MASNDEFDFESFDLDSFDFSGLDDLSPTPRSDDRNPITRLTTSFLSGVKGVATDEEHLKRFFRRALPEGYEQAANLAEETTDTVRSLYNTAAREMAPAIREVKRTLRGALPEESKYIPDAIYRKLKEIIDSDSETEHRSAEQYRQDAYDQEILYGISEIFGQHLSAIEEERSGVELVRENVASKRHEDELSQLIATRQAMERMVGYQDSVMVQYQRKSLELQYRQLFATQDILEVTKASVLDHSNLLDAIVKNTALPETRKIQLNEAFTQTSRDRFMGSLVGMVDNQVGGFRDRLINNLRARVKEGAVNANATIQLALGGSNAMGSTPGLDRTAMGGELAGGLVGGEASLLLADRLSPILERNPWLRESGARLSYLAQNAPELLSEWGERPTDPDARFGGFQNFIKSFIPRGMYDAGMDEQLAENAHQPTHFSVLMGKSITDIIPGYLSQILAAVEGIRDGETPSPMVFDPVRNDWIRQDQRRDDTRDRLFGESRVQMAQGAGENIVRRLDQHGALSEDAKEALKLQFMADSFGGGTFTLARYTDPDSYTKVKDPAVVEELVSVIAALQARSQSSDRGERADAMVQVGGLADDFKYLRMAAGNPRAEMAKLASLGRLGDLRELGLVRQVDGRDEVDFDRYWEEQLRHRPDGNTPPSFVDETVPSSEDLHVDLFVPGETTPRLAYQHLRNGRYRHANGEVLTRFEDIRGPVFDLRGNVVVTEEELLQGLRGQHGNQPFVPATLQRRRPAEWLGDQLGDRVGRVKDWVTNITERAVDTVESEDVYVDGETTPRLLHYKLLAGEYFDAATGTLLTRFEDIRGPVVDRYGQVVLEVSDFKRGLVSKAGRALLWAVGLYWKLLKASFALPLTAVRGVGQFLSRGRHLLPELHLPTLTTPSVQTPDFVVNAAGTVREQATALNEEDPKVIFTQIRDILDERLNKDDPRDGDRDGFRDGSWQQQFANRRQREEGQGGQERPPKDEEKPETFSLFDYALDKLGGLFERFNPFGDGGVDINVGGGDAGDGPDRQDRNGRRRGRADRGRRGVFRRALGGVWRGAKAVGKGALGVGGALLRGGALLGGALGTALSSPVVLGGLALGAAAYGGWSLYRKYAKQRAPLLRYRFYQYGIDPDNADEVAKIIQLEKLLEPHLVLDDEAGFGNGVDVEAVAELFDLTMDNEAHAEGWLRWFTDRFKPIYLTWRASHRRHAPSVDFWELDAQLPTKVKPTLVKEIVRFGQNKELYQIHTSPFGGELTVSHSDIKEMEKELAQLITDEYNGEKKEETSGGLWRQVGEGVMSVVVPGYASRKLAEQTAKVAEQYVNGHQGRGGKSAALTATGQVVAFDRAAEGTLGAIRAIRYRTYGLLRLESERVLALRQLEEAVQEDIDINVQLEAEFHGDPQRYLEQFALKFGVNAAESEQKQAWLLWFTLRFIPTVVNYVTAVHTEDRGLHPFQNDLSQLTAAQQLRIAIATASATAETASGVLSVWLVEHSPFPGLRANLDPATIEGNLNHLRGQVNQVELKEETAQGRRHAVAPPQYDLRQQVDFNESHSPLQRNVTGAGLVQSTLSQLPQDGRGGQSAFSTVVENGMPVVHPGNGTGGNINDIPDPKGDGSWDAYRDMILAVAAMTGVDPALMATKASIESSFRNNARPGTSSAKGLYQFIDSTWRETLAKYGPKYGISPQAKATDPKANALMAAEYLKENERYIKSKVNKTLTDTDYYTAHFMGAGGAAALFAALERSPGADAVQLFPKQAAANRPIFFNENGSRRSVAEVYNELNRRVRRRGAEFDHLRGKVVALTPKASEGEASQTAGGGSTPPPPPLLARAGEAGSQGSDATAPTTTLTPTTTSTTTSAPPPLLAQTAGPVNTAPPITNVSSTFDQSMMTQAVAREQSVRETEVQAQHLSQQSGQQFDAMLNVLTDSNHTLKSMDRTLTDIKELFHAKGGATSVPETTSPEPATTPPAGRRPTQIAGVQTPINLRRTG